MLFEDEFSSSPISTRLSSFEPETYLSLNSPDFSLDANMFAGSGLDQTIRGTFTQAARAGDRAGGFVLLFLPCSRVKSPGTRRLQTTATTTRSSAFTYTT